MQYKKEILREESIECEQKKRNEALEARKQFSHPTGDHMRLYKVFSKWDAIPQPSKRWCTLNFLNERSLQNAKLIRNQLKNILNELNFKVETCNPSLDSADRCGPIQKAILAGFFTNLGTFL